jgi:thiol-disulfide isomerase/thioredoxin
MKFSSQLIVLAAALMTAVSAEPHKKPTAKKVAAKKVAAKKAVANKAAVKKAGTKKVAAKNPSRLLPYNPLDISPAAALQALKKSQKMVLFFGTQWCPYTKSLKPKWRNVQAKYRKKPAYKAVKFYGIDCGRGNACQSLGVKNVPTVRYYTAANKFVEYNGPDSQKDLDDWVAKNVKVAPGPGPGYCTKPGKPTTPGKPTVPGKPTTPVTRPTFEQKLAKLRALSNGIELEREAHLIVYFQMEIFKLNVRIKYAKRPKQKKALRILLKQRQSSLHALFKKWGKNKHVMSLIKIDNNPIKAPAYKQKLQAKLSALHYGIQTKSAAQQIIQTRLIIPSVKQRIQAAKNPKQKEVLSLNLKHQVRYLRSLYKKWGKNKHVMALLKF